MKLLIKNNRVKLFFAGMILLAYLPMLSGLMGIKSDALTVSYPIYHYLASQVQQGAIPFWHYNLNGGFPIHADPGSLFWNFPLWIFPFIGKSLYVYTLLILLHIAIAAIGMYQLGRYLQLSKMVSSLLMFGYVCSGYYVAHLQHPNNILESAWIPFVLLLFLKTVFAPAVRNAIYLAISLFFLLNSGYPGCPIAMLWFLFILFVGILVFHKNARAGAFIGKAVKYLSVAIVLAAILSSPFILSFVEVYQRYFRSTNFNAAKIAGAGGMTLRSLFSVFWPGAGSVDQAFYQSDISWNNIYCGTLLFAFFLLAVRKVKHPLKKPLLLAGCFLLLISFQGYAKYVLFDHLPLLGLVRNNGSFRIYFILTVLIIGCLGIEKWVREKDTILKKIFHFFILVQLLAIVLVPVLFKGNLLPDGGSNMFTTAFISKLTAPLLIVAQSFLNLLLLSAGLIFLKNKRKLLWLLSIDILLSFFINLPFTGLSTKSNAYLQSEISKAAKRINQPVPVAADTLGNIYSPSKYITAPAQFLDSNVRIDYSHYPAMFTNYAQLLSGEGLHTYTGQHCIFYPKQTMGNNDISRFSISNNTISATVSQATYDSIVLFQQYTRNWKCLQDGKPVTVTPNRDGFMCVPVQAGIHTIVFHYRPTWPIIAFFTSLFVWAMLLIYLLPKKIIQKISFLPKRNGL